MPGVKPMPEEGAFFGALLRLGGRLLGRGAAKAGAKAAGKAAAKAAARRAAMAAAKRAAKAAAKKAAQAAKRQAIAAAKREAARQALNLAKKPFQKKKKTELMAPGQADAAMPQAA
jgi:hypothetical protein